MKKSKLRFTLTTSICAAILVTQASSQEPPVEIPVGITGSLRVSGAKLFSGNAQTATMQSPVTFAARVITAVDYTETTNKRGQVTQTLKQGQFAAGTKEILQAVLNESIRGWSLAFTNAPGQFIEEGALVAIKLRDATSTPTGVTDVLEITDFFSAETSFNYVQDAGGNPLRDSGRGFSTIEADAVVLLGTLPVSLSATGPYTYTLRALNFGKGASRVTLPYYSETLRATFNAASDLVIQQ